MLQMLKSKLGQATKKERFTVCNNFLISDKKKSLADNMEETIQGVQSY